MDVPSRFYSVGANFDSKSGAVKNKHTHFRVSEGQTFTKSSHHTDIVIKDNFNISNNLSLYFENQRIAITTGARNLTDFLNVEWRGLGASIWDMTNMLMHNSDFSRRSLMDAARLFEEESVRLNTVTGISENEKALRRQVLERAFTDVAYLLLAGSAGEDAWNNMPSLTRFAQNASQNIRSSGLSTETKGLMIQGLNRAVSFKETFIQRNALHKAMQQHTAIHRSFSTEVLRTLMTRLENETKQYRDRLRAILDGSINRFEQTSTVVPEAEIQPYIPDVEYTDNEISDDARSETSSENPTEDEQQDTEMNI